MMTPESCTHLLVNNVFLNLITGFAHYIQVLFTFSHKLKSVLVNVKTLSTFFAYMPLLLPRAPPYIAQV